MKRYYWSALVLVIIALAAGITNTLVSKPYVTDRIISEDLRTLDTGIVSYYDKNQKLPETLDQLNVSADIKPRINNYEYTRGSEVAFSPTPSPKAGLYYRPEPIARQTFTLCATFKTATRDNRVKILESDSFNPEIHGKGRQCFTDYAYATYPVSALR